MTKAKIAQLANKYLSYDMIRLHTDLPAFPDGRIGLLYAMLGQQPQAAGRKELLTLVTSLVQMGLDTHDLVDNADGAAERSGTAGMRSRQLKVLAGDYFSSRFYQLLAQSGQIDAVRSLSEAVCAVNRTKMSLYAKMKMMKCTAEEYLHYAAELKAGLFLSFTGFMSGLYARLWPEVAILFSRCEVLLQELTNMERANAGWGVWHIMQEGSDEDRRLLADRRGDLSFVQTLLRKYGVADQLGALLRQSIGQLQTLLARLQSDKLQRELEPLLEPFVLASGMKREAALRELV